MKISRRTLRFYGIWVLVGIAVSCLVFLTLMSLEWRPVYQYQKWYRQDPSPEVTLTGRIVRNPLGEEWIRLFALENGTVGIVARGEDFPASATVIYREYSYRLVLPDGESMDIYGAGPDVMQVRLLSGLLVDITGKRVWFELNGVKIKEEFWPKRLRVSDPGG